MPFWSHGYETNIRNGKHAVTCAFATGYVLLPPLATLVSGLARLAQTFGVEQSYCDEAFVKVLPVAVSSTPFASVVGAELHGKLAQWLVESVES